MKRIRNGMILPVILLLLWYIITRMQVFSPYLLPSPGMVWEALTELAASGELVKHLSISLRRVSGSCWQPAPRSRWVFYAGAAGIFTPTAGFCWNSYGMCRLWPPFL